MKDHELSRRAAIGAMSALAALKGSHVMAELPNSDAMKSFELADLMTKHAESGRSYLEFLNEPTLSAGIYRLPKGATDGQSPHAQDEVYYVIEGRAKFTAEGKTIEVKPGGLIFVRAKADHRFVDIEEDLALLVLFSKARPSSGEK